MGLCGKKKHTQFLFQARMKNMNDWDFFLPLETKQIFLISNNYKITKIVKQYEKCLYFPLIFYPVDPSFSHQLQYM